MKNLLHRRVWLVSIASTVLLIHGTAFAHPGCCSSHGGVSASQCGCADGTSFSATCAPYYPKCSNHQPSSASSSSHSSASVKVQPTKKTQTAKCIVKGALPDASCTPGAAIPTATKDVICKAGYSKTVRDVSTATKNQVYAEYGIVTHTASTYEVDHLIPLELGGSNDISNLWPEAATEPTNYHTKDKLENKAHELVCAGKMTLQDAQKNISTNWQQFYSSIFN